MVKGCWHHDSTTLQSADRASNTVVVVVVVTAEVAWEGSPLSCLLLPFLAEGPFRDSVTDSSVAWNWLNEFCRQMIPLASSLRGVS